MRRALVLIPSLVLATLVFTSKGEATRSFDCPVPSCLYLPFIGNPPAVVVSEIYQAITRAGTFRFTGDVIAFKPVYDVVVEVRSVNDDFIFSGPVVLKASLPGQLNPFEIGTNTEYHNIPFEGRVIDWKVESNQIYRNATIVSASSSGGYTGIYVIAEIRNDEARPLLDVKGVIWAVDEMYGIVAVDVADSLAPGETVTFSSFLLGSHYVDYVHVSAQGILQP